MTFNDTHTCPLCEEENAIHRLAAGLDRPYLLCGRCDLVFVPPPSHPSPEEERARYDQHRNSPADTGYRRFLSQLVDPLIRRLKPGAAGLDFGCGPTAVLSLMLEEAGFRMSRYDPFYAPDRGVLDESYDFIACSEAIEHFFRPAGEWSLLLRLLKPGGLLGIMTLLREPGTDFAGWWYRSDITHVCFYSRRTFKWLADRDRLDLEFQGTNIALLGKPGG
ncbi:MAG: class I SAM-dependent methyltransferase [bacterium]